MNMEDHIPISLNVNNSTFLDVSYNLEVKSFSVYNVYNVRLIEAQTHSNTRNIMSTKTRVWPGHVTKMMAVRVFAPRIAVRRWEWEWGRSASQKKDTATIFNFELCHGISVEPTILGPRWFRDRPQNWKLWPCLFFLTPHLLWIFSSIFTRLWQPITLV